MRKGYTFIELLIVISVLGIITVFALDSYSQSEEELGFHTELSAVNSVINNARSAALTESTSGEENDVKYVAVISSTGSVQNAYRYLEQGDDFERNESEDGEILDEVLLDPGENSDVIDFSHMKVLKDSGSWTTIPLPADFEIAIAFSPPLGTCELAFGGSLADDVSMVQLGFSKPGSSEPTRYMYMHNKSCLTELLIEDLTT